MEVERNGMNRDERVAAWTTSASVARLLTLVSGAGGYFTWAFFATIAPRFQPVEYHLDQ
jgi:hypothetical protein